MQNNLGTEKTLAQHAADWLHLRQRQHAGMKSLQFIQDRFTSLMATLKIKELALWYFTRDRSTKIRLCLNLSALQFTKSALLIFKG